MKEDLSHTKRGMLVSLRWLFRFMSLAQLAIVAYVHTRIETDHLFPWSTGSLVLNAVGMFVISFLCYEGQRGQTRVLVGVLALSVLLGGLLCANEWRARTTGSLDDPYLLVGGSKVHVFPFPLRWVRDPVESEDAIGRHLGPRKIVVNPEHEAATFWIGGLDEPCSIALLGTTGQVEEIHDYETGDLEARTRATEAPWDYALVMPGGWFEERSLRPGDSVAFPSTFLELLNVAEAMQFL